jgi:adenylosuccinate lyase
LRDTLLDQQQQTTLTAEELDRLLDPATYLGSSSDFIDRVLHTYYEAGDTDG